MLRALEGGCRVPVGASSDGRGNVVRLRGVVISPDGALVYRGEAEGEEPEEGERGWRGISWSRGRTWCLGRSGGPGDKVIYLVGSGPGDPGLFTLKGVRCMQEADAVVYDRLAPRALLWYARPDAEMFYVGKKPGDPTMSQEEINDLLVEKGRAGMTVVRLKGATLTSSDVAVKRHSR